MILRGILDQSLGQVCVRGYAYLGDLENVSRPDLVFQRNLIAEQKATIVKFLDNNPNLFFPEVILSYVVKYKFPKTGSKTSISPLGEIINGNNFKSNVDEIKFSTKKVFDKINLDSRGSSETKVVTINIDQTKLEELIKNQQQPFLRIDGNHRLSAAAEFKEREGVTKLIAPFCLILLPDEKPDAKLREATKFEKTVFHNINSKSVPLTDEEIYKVIVDDPINFNESEVKNREDLGVSYYFARQILGKITASNLTSIAHLLVENLGKNNETPCNRTIVIHFFDILLKYKLIRKSFKEFGSIERTFKKVEQRYEDYELLKQSKARGLLEAFLYFTFLDNKFNLDWFTDWVIENHIYELKEVAAYDLIAIFEKILLSKHRTIFISMQFSNTYCENHYEFISNLIKEINKETSVNIKLYPLRIDKFKNGSAYKIPDEILDKIFSSGLLIADLTMNNPNVYHEVGYLMGINRLRTKRKLNLLLICNTTVHKDFPSNIGFNIRNHKILPFEDTNKLKDPLKTEVFNFYFKNG
jgi:hypothetical protein